MVEKFTVMKRLMMVSAALVVLGACSTTVQEPPAVNNTAGSAPALTQVQVQAVSATTQIGMEDQHLRQLESEVREEVSKRPNQGRPVNVAMTVTEFNVKSGGARFVGGMFVGSNKMRVTVQLNDPDSDALIREFQVSRSSNPGGYGMFYDQIL